MSESVFPADATSVPLSPPSPLPQLNSTNHTDRFRALFPGRSDAYGVSDITGELRGDGKRLADSRLVKSPLTPEHIRLHLAGERSLGILPAWRDADEGIYYCRFGVIDIDEYIGFDIADLARRVAEIDNNLVVSRSKSGGAHIYYRASDQVTAASMHEMLHRIAGELGLPADVEIFPRAIDRNDPGEYPGGWVNLPYFGDGRQAIGADGRQLLLAEFLNYAEARVVHLPGGTGDRPRVLEPRREQRKDYENGAREGNRFNYLKSDLGLYLAKHPDSSADELLAYANYARYSVLEPTPTNEEWRAWKVSKLISKLLAREAEKDGQESTGKPRTKDELILLTEAQIRDMTQLAVDPIGRVHKYDETVGCYEFDDHKLFANRLKKNLGANSKPYALGGADVDRLLANLRIGGTPEFWCKPPLTEINVANGVLNVESQELRQHSAEFLWPNRFNIRFDPAAVCPETDRFLNSVLPEDECVLFFEMLGMLLIPELAYQTAFLLWGTGANGKSMFLELIKFVLGDRNYSTVPLDKLEANTFASSSLVGKLANIEEDMTVNKLPGSAIFKTIVGGGTVNVEQKYRDAHDVRLYSRLIVSCNRFPRCADNSAGFFRRWLVLPFTKKNFDGEDSGERVRPRALLSKLEAEAPGILNKAVLALAEVRQRDGFTETQRMKDAKMEFKSLTDSLSAWLDENTVSGANMRVQQKQLRNAYNRFCDKKGYAPLLEKEFSDKVVEYRPTIECRLSHDARYFVGIGMRADAAFVGEEAIF